MLYYTNVGTVTHSVFQAIVGKGGRIIGNWACPKCGFKRRMSTYKVCDECKTSMTYEEVEVSYKAWRGHLDNIYIAKNKELWIIDYKTCMTKFIHEKWGPSQSYVEQQSHYVVLLEEKLQRKIAGWMLVYLARENPIKMQRIISRRLREETKERLRKENNLYTKMHKKLWKIESLSEVKPLYLNKRCSNRADHDRTFRFDECEHVKECFKRSKMVGKIKRIVNESEHLPLIQYMPDKIKKDLYD